MRRDEYNEIRIKNNDASEYHKVQDSEYSSFNCEYKVHKHELNDDYYSKLDTSTKRNVKSEIENISTVSKASTTAAVVPSAVVGTSVVTLILAGTGVGLTLFPTSAEKDGFPIKCIVEERYLSLEIDIPYSYFSNLDEESGDPIIEQDLFVARLLENKKETYDLECYYECNFKLKTVTLYSYYEDLKEDTDYVVGVYELKEEQYTLISDEYSFHTGSFEPETKSLPNPQIQQSEGETTVYLSLDFSYFEEINAETGMPIIEEGRFGAMVYFGDAEDDYNYEFCDADLSKDGTEIIVLIRLTDYDSGNYRVKIIDNINLLETELVDFTIEGTETPNYSATNLVATTESCDYYIEVPADHFTEVDPTTAGPMVDETLFKAKLTGINNNYEDEVGADGHEFDVNENVVFIYFQFTDVPAGNYNFVAYEYIDDDYLIVCDPLETVVLDPEQAIMLDSCNVDGTSASFYGTVKYEYFSADEIDATTGDPIISDNRFTAIVRPLDLSEGDSADVEVECVCYSTYQEVSLSATVNGLTPNIDYQVYFYDSVAKKASDTKTFTTVGEEIPDYFEVHESVIAPDYATFYIEIPYSYFTEINSATGQPIISDGRFNAHVAREMYSAYVNCSWVFDNNNQMVTVYAEANELASGTDYSIAFQDLKDEEEPVQISAYYEFVTPA